MKPAKPVRPVVALKAKVAKRPAEAAAPTVWVALEGVLHAFGVDPGKAAAVSGLIAVLAPMVVTYFVAKVDRKRRAAIALAAMKR